MPKLAESPRVVLVGEANPYGGDPYYALYPSPDGCSGHRLCCLILGMRRVDYLEVFERVNLCPREWNMREARKMATELSYDGTDKVLILLGAKVGAAFGIKPWSPFVVGAGLVTLPHPSGLCRLWNDDTAITRARHAVEQVAPHLVHFMGKHEE